MTSDHINNGTSVDVGFWHKADVQTLSGLGPLTGAQRTFAHEDRFTAAFRTLQESAASIGF